MPANEEYPPNLVGRDLTPAGFTFEWAGLHKFR